jgi:hypothetical protein
VWTAAGTAVATLTGHTAPVRCLAWSPDSQTVASASADGTVRLWNRTGRLVHILPGVDPLFSLAWSPDGTILAAGAIAFPGPTATGPAQPPGIVTLWRPDGTRLHTISAGGTGGKFLNLAWSPDGALIAAGAVQYADWHADGSPVAVLPAGDTVAWALAWAPDSMSLAVGDESGNLVLDWRTGDIIGSAHFPGGVNALSYAPDERGLAVGSTGRVQFVHPDDPAKVVWSASTADGAGRVAWSPDGRRLAVAITGGLAVLRLDGSAAAILGSCPGDPVAFAWGGRALAATMNQGRLCVWEAP